MAEGLAAQRLRMRTRTRHEADDVGVELFKTETSGYGERTKSSAKSKGFLSRLDLDLTTILLMAKGALPPTILLSICQADVVANQLGTLGYLAAIVSIFSMAILPRARYLQNLFISLITVSMASAGALFTIFCATEARRHTTAPFPNSATSSAGAPTSLQEVPYNSSASVISGVWLFFWIYISNALRAKQPDFQYGVIVFSIVIIVGCMNAPLIPTMTYGITFMKSLMQSAYLGLAMGTGVALFIVPITTRKVVNIELLSILTSLQRCLKAYKALLHSFENHEAMADLLVADRKPRPEVQAAKDAIRATNTIYSKFQVDLRFAKQEIGTGNLASSEFKQINQLVKQVLLPTSGLESVAGIFQHFAHLRGWTEQSLATLSEGDKAERQRGIEEWVSNMVLVHQPFEDIIDVMYGGIEHIIIQLRLKKRSAIQKVTTTGSRDDVEATAEATAPGDHGFTAYFDKASSHFYNEKHHTLLEWARKHGFKLPDDFFVNPESTQFELADGRKELTEVSRQQNQRHLFLLLFMEFLLFRMSRSLLALLHLVDTLVTNGTMSRTRLVIPNFSRIRKMLTSLFRINDHSSTQTTMRDVNEGSHQVYFGSSYKQVKDPEHLPPTNLLQRMGDQLRRIPHFFRSTASAFGFRVAVACISLAIPLFVRQSQLWANKYRLFWAVIMIAISMSPTSGNSLFGFLSRAIGTVVAMLLAWIVYYVPGNGRIPGVLILYWFFVALVMYIPIKKPQFTAAGLIIIVTITLIIGYELEAKKLGQQAIANSGVYLGVLLFGPARLATVLAGLSVAFVFSIFPYPITEHSILRRDLAGSIYMLAKYYSAVDETVLARIRGDYGIINDKTIAGARLHKTRLKIHSKQLLLLDNLRQHSNFTRWEIPIGGRFPKEKYDEIINSIENITSHMALISYASQSFANLDADGKNSNWTRSFRKVMTSVQTTSHETVMLLTLLSGSMRDGRPLPPYMAKPRPYELTRRLEEVDKDILSVRHINEPGYATFAVMQLAARCIGVDVEALVDRIKELVGELDFSFHVIQSMESSKEEIYDESGKRKGD